MIGPDVRQLYKSGLPCRNATPPNPESTVAGDLGVRSTRWASRESESRAQRSERVLGALDSE